MEIEDKMDPLEQLLYVDLKSYLSDDILMKVDRASMACSLEVRPPFLDDAFVDFVAKIPFKLKLHNFTTKYILKKKACKNFFLMI